MPQSHVALTSEGDDEFELWHNRMGHLSPNKLKVLRGLNSGVTFRSVPDKICVLCLTGKQQRQTFPKHSDSESRSVLDLVHSDVCGALPETWNRANYILTIIN